MYDDFVSFYAGGVQLEKTVTKKQFASWLTTRTNARGLLYKAHVASRYAVCLRTKPLKVDISPSPEE